MTTDPAPPARRSPLRWLPVVLLILAIPAVIIGGVTSAFRHFVRPADTSGVRQLREVGQAVRRYAQDHAGQYPPTLADLVAAGDLPADLAACPPNADGVRAPYAYRGGGLAEQTVSNGTVLAYEPPAAGDAGGSAVLYADGTVAWVADGVLDKELDNSRPPPQRPEP